MPSALIQKILAEIASLDRREEAELYRRIPGAYPLTAEKLKNYPPQAHQQIIEEIRKITQQTGSMGDIMAKQAIRNEEKEKMIDSVLELVEKEPQVWKDVRDELKSLKPHIEGLQKNLEDNEMIDDNVIKTIENNAKVMRELDIKNIAPANIPALHKNLGDVKDFLGKYRIAMLNTATYLKVSIGQNSALLSKLESSLRELEVLDSRLEQHNKDILDDIKDKKEQIEEKEGHLEQWWWNNPIRWPSWFGGKRGIHKAIKELKEEIEEQERKVLMKDFSILAKIESFIDALKIIDENIGSLGNYLNLTRAQQQDVQTALNAMIDYLNDVMHNKADTSRLAAIYNLKVKINGIDHDFSMLLHRQVNDIYQIIRFVRAANENLPRIIEEIDIIIHPERAKNQSIVGANKPGAKK